MHPYLLDGRIGDLSLAKSRIVGGMAVIRANNKAMLWLSVSRESALSLPTVEPDL
jgi:hypothetical protein